MSKLPSFFPTGQDRYRGSLPINWFLFKDNEKGPGFLGAPGNVLWSSAMPGMMVRGFKAMGGYLYVVVQTTDTTCTVYQADKIGNANAIGTLETGTGPLYIVPSASGFQIQFNDNVNGYYYDLFPKFWTQNTDYLGGIVVQPNPPNLLYYQAQDTGGTSGGTPPIFPTVIGETVIDGTITWKCIPGIPYFAQITDPNFLGGGPAVLQDNYVIYAAPNSNQWGTSALSDCTTYPADSQATMGSDIVAGILTSHLNIWLMGKKKNTEIWYDAGGTPFPFSKLVGTLVEEGLGAPMSAVNGDNTVLFVSTNRQVIMASGFQPRYISTEKIDRELESYAQIDDLIGFYQVQRGHKFYWLISPSANRTLVADVSMIDKQGKAEWHVRSTFPGNGRHRANCYCYFNGKHLVGDWASGNIYELDPKVYTDNGDPLVAQVQSREYWGGGALIQFPDLQLLWAQPGQGFQGTDPVLGVDPQVLLQKSNDGGSFWGKIRKESMGKVGQTRKRTIFRQNGIDFQRIFQLTVSEPVNRDLLMAEWI
ncbi:MAG: hypothetical protein ACYDHZ_00430 [Dehalococcoidia bacterium]